VEIDADDLESVYDVRRPMGILSDGNNEGISPLLLGNVSEGEVDPRPPFTIVEEPGNYEDGEEDLEVETDASPFTSQEFPILASSSTLAPINNGVADLDVDLMNRSRDNLPQVIISPNIIDVGGEVPHDAGAFQRDCLIALGQADDFACIGHCVNKIDEDTFDLEDEARELSIPVDPENPSSISVGQYCIDQLIILKVAHSHFKFFYCSFKCFPLFVRLSSINT